ncbi:hypothetical protein Tel_00505 [Candidatus Tenderia electrophaga]|uniref:Cytochrome c domain-containing protein n=1 Tax=Candidatus Tenderia electrophaga TaxID=1748243 RepID=A0A0S2T970_9GAMM|nr:hypothetical protein Tel_00505 [Candidatus Tenderia electrophaga]
MLPLLLIACELPQQSSHTVLPASDSKGAQLMKKYCSDCHAPPSPAAHTAKEWPNVIYRMQERRRMKAYTLIDENEERLLLDYLKEFAKS